MAESTSTKRQHEENNSESDDEFVGPLPSEAVQTKAKKKKGLLFYKKLILKFWELFLIIGIFVISFGV